MKILLKICLFFIALFVGGYLFWLTLIYEPMPKDRYNFIGMSRMEVLEWIDENGRTTKYKSVKYGDEYWNKIEIRIFPSTWDFNKIDDVLKDEYIMKLDAWGIGGMSLRHGTRLYYKLYFEEDKVIKQKDITIRNW